MHEGIERSTHGGIERSAINNVAASRKELAPHLLRQTDMRQADEAERDDSRERLQHSVEATRRDSTRRDIRDVPVKT